MQISPGIYQKNKRSMWLLCIGLLLCASVFSEYTGKSYIQHQQAIQTSWQYNNAKTATRSISYKKAVAALYETNAISRSKEFQNAVHAYNRLVQVKFINACSIFNATESVHSFMRKVIPEDSEENLHTSSI
jgi:hypothetical protein